MIKIVKFFIGWIGMNVFFFFFVVYDVLCLGVLLLLELLVFFNLFCQVIIDVWLKDEVSYVCELLVQVCLFVEEQVRVQVLVVDLVGCVCVCVKDQGVIEVFMCQYDLGSEEGVLLMCVVEVLLCILDQDIVDKLICDKLVDVDWEKYLGGSDLVLVNVFIWGLMLIGKLVQMNDVICVDVFSVFKCLVGCVGELVVCLVVCQVMKIMGYQFVMGCIISEVLLCLYKGDNVSYCYLFDMFGEGVLIMKDVFCYLEDYCCVIYVIGGDYKVRGGCLDGDVNNVLGILIKLLVLYLCYEYVKCECVLKDLVLGVLELVQLVKSYGIGCIVDVEEFDCLELLLDIIEQVFFDVLLVGWDGFGVVVQVYQKCMLYMIDYLVDMVCCVGCCLQVCLVKGVYWDVEIKCVQIEGYLGYLVFICKQNIDVFYLVCVKWLFIYVDVIYLMFVMYNVYIIVVVCSIVNGGVYEYQKLYGMGDDLYVEVVLVDCLGLFCCVYVLVGLYEDLLLYLVCCLLENGVNFSFVNCIIDECVLIVDLICDLVEMVVLFELILYFKILLLVDLLCSQNYDRKNFMGVNFVNDNELCVLVEQINVVVKLWQVVLLVLGVNLVGVLLLVINLVDICEVVGQWLVVDVVIVQKVLVNVVVVQLVWNCILVVSCVVIFEYVVDQLEVCMLEFMVLCVKEVGKSLFDSIVEVCEVVDFLCYYVKQVCEQFSYVEKLFSLIGEFNELQLYGRGVFVCISLWNFLLVIFLGQVVVVLVVGNSVIVKLVEQINLIGYYVVKLLYDVGVLVEVVQFLLGDGVIVGVVLIVDLCVVGVVFIGFIEIVCVINCVMVVCDVVIGVLIVEIGGQNVFIVDFLVLLEQLVKDVIGLVFIFVGQCCLVVCVLFVQDDIVDKVMIMLVGVMKELKVGNLGLLFIDVGLVIDVDVLKILQDYVECMDCEVCLIVVVELFVEIVNGIFFVLCVYELKDLGQLQKEVFGLVLYVICWKGDQFDVVIDQINVIGYGLILGVYLCIDEIVDCISNGVYVGNVYVNCNQIGVVVGVQLFGGQGLFGIGLKVGGLYYLLCFVIEKMVMVNIIVVGGNVLLLILGD